MDPKPPLDKTALPTILPPSPLSAFLLYLLDNHTPPTTLIICCSRQTFLDALLASINHDTKTTTTPPLSQQPEQTPHEPAPPHPLLHRTLHLLSASRTIDLTFITSVPALHAYFSTLPSRACPLPSHTTRPPRASQHSKSTEMPTLAILSILALHRPTPSFSAQGLTRAFAAAVEAAYARGQRLVFWEAGVIGEEVGLRDAEMMSDGDGDGEGEQEPVGAQRQMNPWEEEVPILDASTKTFGIGGMEREWLGRRVKVGEVVGRWCRFEEMAWTSE